MASYESEGSLFGASRSATIVACLLVPEPSLCRISRCVTRAAPKREVY
jgi:hypothetical protein